MMALSSRYAFATVTGPTPESSKLFRQPDSQAGNVGNREGAETGHQVNPDETL
jgi:hypothetical protein